MNVLVTGATGFLGANVIRHLLARGDSVRCTVRDTSPGLCLAGLDVGRVRVPLSDTEGLAKALDGVEGIFHVAGTWDPSPTGRARMHAVHVEATRSLCEAALVAGVRRLVFCSSSVTVGFGSRLAPGDEATPLGDLDGVYGVNTPLRWYHDTKREAEALVGSFVARGLETVVVNPDYVVGAWDLKPTSGGLIVAMAKRPVPFYPPGGKCFVDADDCAAGHLAAMDKGVPGQRYLLGNHNLSYLEFMTVVAEQVGRKPPRIAVPRGALAAAGALGGRLRRIAPGLDPQVLTSMGVDRYRDGSRARKELGVPVTPIDVSVAKALRWFREHGYCP
jgi:dihydroflavonol-4-reductase